MKYFALALAAMIVASPALAQKADQTKPEKPTTAQVKTGKDVKGPTNYVLDENGKVVGIADPSKPGNPLFWDTVLPPSGGGE